MHKNIKILVFANSERLCSICKDDTKLIELRDCYVTSCGHMYHNHCFLNYFIENRTCLVCKETIFLENIITNIRDILSSSISYRTQDTAKLILKNKLNILDIIRAFDLAYKECLYSLIEVFKKYISNIYIKDIPITHVIKSCVISGYLRVLEFFLQNERFKNIDINAELSFALDNDRIIAANIFLKYGGLINVDYMKFTNSIKNNDFDYIDFVIKYTNIEINTDHLVLAVETKQFNILCILLKALAYNASYIDVLKDSAKKGSNVFLEVFKSLKH